MAFKKRLNEICGITLVLSALLSSASAVDCHGKSFHCVNSTHFMICVDLGGGISQSIDNLLIPCPSPTVCLGTNRFECEFPALTTPIPTLSNIIIETTQPLEDILVTTNSPHKKSTKEYSEKYMNTESLMSLADSFTKDTTFDYTTVVTPSSLTDVNSKTNKIESIPVTTETIFDDTTIVPAIKESTFNDTTTGLKQVTEIIAENFATGATEVITEILLKETTTAEPNNTQVNTETITTISSDSNSNLSLTTELTSGGLLKHTGADVLRTDSILSAEGPVTVVTDSHTTVVNNLNIEQSEFAAPDVVQNAEYAIISQQITTTDTTFDTKSVNTDQPQISILPVMTGASTVNSATTRQSSLPDELQYVFDHSSRTVDTVISYDVNELGSTTYASKFAQNVVTEQSTSNSNEYSLLFDIATETPLTAEIFTPKAEIINNNIGEEPQATVGYPIKNKINTVSSTELPVTLAGSFQTVTNELPLTDLSLISVTNDPERLNFKGNEALSTEEIPIIKDDTKLNIEKNTQQENIQERTTDYLREDINEVVTEQPNTHIFENAVTTDITVDLPITASMAATSEISDTMSRTLGTTEQPTTITFEEKYQTVENIVYITEPSIIYTTNDQESQQSITDNTVKAKPMLINRNNVTSDKNNSSSTLSDITSTPATDVVFITIEVITEESNMNKSLEGKFLEDRINNTALISKSTASTTIPNNVKQNTMSSETDTHTNVNGIIVTASDLPITDRNHFILSALPLRTDTTPSANENIVTTSAPSTTDKNNNVNEIIVITSDTLTTAPNNLKQNIMSSGSDTNTNENGNIVTPSTLPINDQNEFIQTTLPHRTDTILSANENIVTTLAASIADTNNLKQNTMSSGSDTNTNENGNIVTLSTLPINEQNEFIQTTLPHSTYTILSANENIVTTLAPSIADTNNLKQNTMSSGSDTNTKENGHIVTPSTLPINDQNEFIQIILPHRTGTILSANENIVTTLAPSIADTNNLKENTMSSGSDTNTKENGHIVTPSTLPINDQNEFIQITLPHRTGTILSANENIVTTLAPSIADTNNLKQNTMSSGSDTNANENGNIVTSSTLPINDQNEFIQTTLPHRTDTILSTNENIVTTLAPSITDTNNLKQNIMSSGSDSNTNENGNIVTPSTLPINDQNEFIQTTLPYRTDTILSANENIVTTSAPSTIDTNDLKQNTVLRETDNNVNVNGIIGITSATSTRAPNNLEQNTISSGSNTNTNENGNIVTPSALLITDQNDFINAQIRIISSTKNTEHIVAKDSDIVFKSSTPQSQIINVQKSGTNVPHSNNLKGTTSHHITASGDITQNKISMSDIQTSFSIVKETNNIIQLTGKTHPLSNNSVNAEITQINSTRAISGQNKDIKQSIHETNNLGTLHLGSNSNSINELINESPITVTPYSINQQSDLTKNVDGNDVVHSKRMLISRSAGKSTIEAQPTISQNNTSKLASTTKADLGTSSTAAERTSASKTAVINDSSLLILQNSTNSGIARDSKLQRSAQSRRLVTVNKKAVSKVITTVVTTQPTTETVPPVIENPKKQVTNNLSRNYTCINGIRGRHSNNDDCRKFYICVGITEPIVGHCPPNTVFSDIKKLCTKNMSHCIRENEFKCPSVGRFSDVVKENVYYICVSHKNHLYRFKFQCQIGFTLDKTTVRCVENKEVESNESVSTSISESAGDSSSNKIRSVTSIGSMGSDSWSRSSTSRGNTSRGSGGTAAAGSSSSSSIASSSGDSDSSSSKSKKSKLKPEGRDEDDDDDDEVFECEKAGKFPVRNDCRRYYLCKKNRKSQFRRKLKKCDSSDVFHKTMKKCVDADSYEC